MGWTVVYLLASAVALAVAALSYERDRRHAVQIAAMLALSCAAYNSTWITGNSWFWPPMDAAATWFVAVRFRRSPSNSKGLILIAYTMQMVAHLRWQVGDHFNGAFVGYGLTLNLLFVVQLLAVSSSGGLRLGRLVRDGLVDRLHYGGRRRAGLQRERPPRPAGRLDEGSQR